MDVAPKFLFVVFLGVLVWGFVMLAGMAISCSEELHSHPAQDQEIHERFYSRWLRPDMRNDQGARHLSCCDKKDCYPTEFKNVGGTWFALRREDQEWVVIPTSKIEQNLPDGEDNPDGRNHVCMSPPGGSNTVYCAILGGGM